MLFSRHQPLSVLLDTSFVHAEGHYWPAFLASALAAMFCYYGFEACGDVAEETPDAGRQIPRAMRLTIYVGGAAALWVCLALVLAVPDIDAILSGRDKDPVVTILKAAMGEAGFRVVIAVVMISFASAQLSLQAAASRLLFAYARDEMIAGSGHLRRLSPGRHVPANALILAGVIPALIALSAPWLQDAVATIISFAAIGIYIAFQMIVFAALVARLRGWKPAGTFRLGLWGWPVNLLAFAYGVGAIINMAWPRSPQDPWFSNYGMILSSAAVLAFGAVYMWAGRPYDRGHAPAGDAHRLAGPGASATE
jgi:amino acid transporter